MIRYMRASASASVHPSIGVRSERGTKEAAYLQGRTKKNRVSNVSRSCGDDGISEEGKDSDGDGDGDGRTDPEPGGTPRARKISESRIAYSACGRFALGRGARRQLLQVLFKAKQLKRRRRRRDEEQQGGAAPRAPCHDILPAHEAEIGPKGDSSDPRPVPPGFTLLPSLTPSLAAFEVYEQSE